VRFQHTRTARSTETGEESRTGSVGTRPCRGLARRTAARPCCISWASGRRPGSATGPVGLSRRARGPRPRPVLVGVSLSTSTAWSWTSLPRPGSWSRRGEVFRAGSPGGVDSRPSVPPARPSLGHASLPLRPAPPGPGAAGHGRSGCRGQR